MPTRDGPQDAPTNLRIGRYVTTVAFDETVSAYVPPPLPPEPPLALSLPLLQRLSEADRAIGRLDGVAALLPDKALFLYMYVLANRRHPVAPRRTSAIRECRAGRAAARRHRRRKFNAVDQEGQNTGEPCLLGEMKKRLQ
jgi:hypothetical protein